LNWFVKENETQPYKKMPNYFGVRLSLQDAFHLFSENYQKTFNNIFVSFDDPRHVDSYLCERLNEIAEKLRERPVNTFNTAYKITKLFEHPSINVFYIGNEQCVIGWKMEKISANVDEFILTLINLKANYVNVTNYFKVLHNEDYMPRDRFDKVKRICESQPAIIEYNE
jgi:hypothetical protein